MTEILHEIFIIHILFLHYCFLLLGPLALTNSENLMYDVKELVDREHKCVNIGKIHACGQDTHVLLRAAKMLHKHKDKCQVLSMALYVNVMHQMKVIISSNFKLKDDTRSDGFKFVFLLEFKFYLDYMLFIMATDLL